MKNQGISLISLIITIIVIIILAAIVIFTGLGTPDSAQFSNFCQQVDNVQMAVTNRFADLKVKHAISGDYRTDEQIYLEIATAADHGQYVVMGNNSVISGDANTGIKTTESKGVQLIVEATSNQSDNKFSLGMTLPKVRQSNNAWYVTKDGRVFNATGYNYDKKTYFNASLYNTIELPATETTESDRAETIGAAIMAGNQTTTMANTL